MRVLFKEDDNTLAPAEIILVEYDKEDQCLAFYNGDDDVFFVPHISPDEANALMRELYMNNMLDMSDHTAYLNEEPPADEPKEEDAEEPGKPVIFAGIFGPKDQKHKDPWEV